MFTFGEHRLVREPERIEPMKGFKFKGAQVSDAFEKRINEHFSHFLKPHCEGYQCIKCDKPLVAKTMVEQVMGFGSFTWGLVHGQGYCRECGWPTTGYHYVIDDDGKSVNLGFIPLQAHPEDVTPKPPTKELLDG